MFTQCPECSAVFEITATDLAVAGGFVRCGQCNRSFDALISLTDKVPVDDPVAAAKDRPATAHSLFRSKTASQREPAQQAATDTGPDQAIDEAGAAPQQDESSQQADAKAEPRATGEPDEAADDASDEIEADDESAADVTLQAELATDDTDEPDEPDDEILLDESYRPPDAAGDDDEDDDFFADEWDEDDNDTLAAEDRAEEADSGDTPDESALFSLPLPELTTLERVGRTRLPEKLEGGAAVHDSSAQTVAPAAAEPLTAEVVTTYTTPAIPRANDAFDAADARDLRDYLSAPKNRARTAMWGAGAALMALLLVTQIVHRNRGELVIHPRLGPVVQSVYGLLGAEPQPNWRIGEYKVVGQARLFQMPAQDGADSNPAALRFVAIIANGANLPQPPPMVRLTLRDRWGDATAIRDFTPPEYLAESAIPGELLEPGQRLRVVLNLRDPGDIVDSFDFDMCLPDGAGTLRCADEPAG